MSISYLPGWWDEANKNGAFTNLFAQLPALIQPDNVAQKKFERMVQQDPTLIGQISNMDPTARQAFAKAMGFKNYDKSGIGTIEEGQQLKDQRELNKFLQTLTPEQLQERMAGRAGTKSTTTLQREGTFFGLGVDEKKGNIRKNEQEIKLNDMELREKEEFNTLMGTLKVKYPTENINLQRAVIDFVNGKIETPELQRITNDRTLAPAFNTLVDLYKQRVGLAAQFRMSSLRGPEEKLLGLQFMERGVDNAQAKINAAQKALNDLGLAGQSMQPEQYNSALAALGEARQEHKEMVNAYQVMLQKEFGGKYPGAFNPQNETLDPPPNVPPVVSLASLLFQIKPNKLSLPRVQSNSGLPNGSRPILGLRKKLSKLMLVVCKLHGTYKELNNDSTFSTH
jgi:hypothetical protein